MQEEVQSKTVTLSINATKLTARTLKQALSKFLAYKSSKHKETKGVTPHGKQSVKQLARQNQGLTNIEITDKNIKDFDRVARKYGVDYALKKDKTSTPPKYLVFFKAKDADALTAAFKEYTAVTVKKQNKEPIVQKIKSIADRIKTLPAKVKNKDRGER